MRWTLTRVVKMKSLMRISIKSPKRLVHFFIIAGQNLRLLSLFAPHAFAAIELHKSIPSTSGVVGWFYLTFPTQSVLKEDQRWFPVNA